MERKPSAFTLVELLVVITIIGMLVGLLVPAVIAARERARQARCVNQLRELAMATLHYETVRGQLPGWQNQAPVGGGQISWVVALFPYLDREDLWEQWRTGSGDTPVYEQVVCPSDLGNPGQNPQGPLNYVANINLFHDRVGGGNTQTLEGLRSAQRTVMISERVYDASRPVGPWSGTDQNRLTFNWTAAPTVHGLAGQAAGLSSNHGGLIHVAFADGRVEALAPETSTADYRSGP